MFVSDYFQLNDEMLDRMDSLGVFDALLDKDSSFFINIIRLKSSTVPEFIEAYQHINSFFSDVATLLDAADAPSMKDKMYASARSRFHFHEVNGINLGFSKSGYGAGWGPELSDRFLFDAYQIVKKGSKQPEIFHLVSLFEEDVGPDRLSDMIATIIEPEIRKYTLRIMKELGITPETHSDLTFMPNGLVKSPYKRAYIYLLPEEILHELPIARCWDDIDRVAHENNVIRQEISAEIGAEWTQWASAERKNYLKNNIFMNPEACERVIAGYKDQQLDAINVKQDVNYLVELLLKAFKKAESFEKKADPPNTLEATRAVIGIFKDWVENNRGWAQIQDAPNQKREKAVQRLMHLGAKYYVEVNNLDISCEPDEGCGPSDIKLSRGTDKTIAEIKLSTNGQYLHGYETQIKRYGIAERTHNLIYVFVDTGNSGRRSRIIKLYESTKRAGKLTPELIIIDARPQKAASTFDEHEWEADLSALQQMTIEVPDFDMSSLSDLEIATMPDIDMGDFSFPDSDDSDEKD